MNNKEHIFLTNKKIRRQKERDFFKFPKYLPKQKADFLKTKPLFNNNGKQILKTGIYAGIALALLGSIPKNSS